MEVLEDDRAAGARTRWRQRLDAHPASLQAHRLCERHDGQVPVLEVAGVAVSVDIIEVVAACSTR